MSLRTYLKAIVVTKLQHIYDCDSLCSWGICIGLMLLIALLLSCTRKNETGGRAPFVCYWPLLFLVSCILDHNPFGPFYPLPLRKYSANRTFHYKAASNLTQEGLMTFKKWHWQEYLKVRIELFQSIIIVVLSKPFSKSKAFVDVMCSVTPPMN